MNREQEINILNVEINLIEQKMAIINSNLETCIKNISDNQRQVSNFLEELKREDSEHKKLLSSPCLEKSGNCQENRAMRERITFHWRHIKYIEGKIINLEFLNKNQEQEKNNLKSEMNLLRIEKDKKIRILEQQKNNFNNIKSIVNHEKKYNDNSNKPNTIYSKLT